MVTMDKKEDWCTGFYENWYTWKGFKKIYIGDCCKIHDDECNTMNFIKCLWKKRVVGAILIAGVAMKACIFRYFKI